MWRRSPSVSCLVNRIRSPDSSLCLCLLECHTRLHVHFVSAWVSCQATRALRLLEYHTRIHVHFVFAWVSYQTTRAVLLTVEATSCSFLKGTHRTTVCVRPSDSVFLLNKWSFRMEVQYEGHAPRINFGSGLFLLDLVKCIVYLLWLLYTGFSVNNYSDGQEIPWCYGTW
jgi:hypothetical protein